MSKIAEEITRYYFNCDEMFYERKKTLTDKQLKKIFSMLKTYHMQKYPWVPYSCSQCIGSCCNSDNSICLFFYSALGRNGGCNFERFNKGLNLLKEYFEQRHGTEIE